jgi:hypothetical protein
MKTGFLFDGKQVDTLEMASPLKIPHPVFLHALGALFSMYTGYIRRINNAVNRHWVFAFIEVINDSGI